jgi:hypothetical protein
MKSLYGHYRCCRSNMNGLFSMTAIVWTIVWIYFGSALTTTTNAWTAITTSTSACTDCRSRDLYRYSTMKSKRLKQISNTLQNSNDSLFSKRAKETTLATTTTSISTTTTTTSSSSSSNWSATTGTTLTTFTRPQRRVYRRPLKRQRDVSLQATTTGNSFWNDFVSQSPFSSWNTAATSTTNAIAVTEATSTTASVAAVVLDETSLVVAAVGGIVAVAGIAVALTRLNDNSVTEDADFRSYPSPPPYSGPGVSPLLTRQLQQTIEEAKLRNVNGVDDKARQMWMTRDRIRTVPNESSRVVATIPPPPAPPRNDAVQYMQGLGSYTAAPPPPSYYAPYTTSSVVATTTAAASSNTATAALRSSIRTSYAMSDWSPYTSAPNMGSVSATNAYLATMSDDSFSDNGAKSSSSSSSAILTAPLSSLATTTVPVPQSLSQPYHWSFDTTEKAAPRTGRPRGKSSYGMTQWSPQSGRVGGGSNSGYLDTLATAAATAAAVSPTTAPLPTTWSTTLSQPAALPSPPPAPATTSYTNTWPPVSAASSSTESAAKKSYSMTSWSPNRTVPPSNPLLQRSGDSAATPSWPVAPAAATPLQQAAAESNTWPLQPPEMTTAEASGPPKKSYAMTTWSPNKTVPANPLQSGGSGSGTDAAFSSSQPPSWSVAAPAPAPPIEPSGYVASWSALSSSPSGVESTVRKSYAMTTWSPNKPVPSNPLASGSSASYLASVSSTVSTPYGGAASPSWSLAPATPLEPSGYVSSWSTPPSSPAMETTGAAVRKSYAMTSWSPNQAVPPNPLLASNGSSASYLASMASTAATTPYGGVAPPYGASSTPAVAPESNAYSSNWSSMPNDASGPKKSYAMTTWSPNKTVPPNPASGSSAAYLAGMSSAASTTQYSNGALPSWSSATAVPPESSARWSSMPYDAPPAMTEASAPKKSYAMTSWSPSKTVPPNPASGSSAAYLAGMSTTSGSAPYNSGWSAPSPTPEVTSYASSWSAPTETAGPKKSYAMTRWSPSDAVPPNLASGSSAAYLASMSTARTPTYDSSAWAAPSPVPETTSYTSSWSVPVETSGPKKSYAMTRWSPSDAVPANPASGSSATYLAGMSTLSGSATAPFIGTSGPKGSYAATRWSPSDPVPANPAGGSSADYLAAMSTSSPTSYSSASSPYSSTAPASYTSLSESAPKKSYAMTTWSPNNSVPPNAASGSSATYLASMSPTSSSAAVTPSSSAPPPAPVSSGFTASWPPTTIPSAHSSGAKGSYAASKWSPDKPVSVNPASGSSVAYLATMSTLSWPSYGSAQSPSRSSVPAVAPETASYDTSRESGEPKKSYAMTSWSPNNSLPPNPASGSSAAYLASMSSSSTMSYASAASPSWSLAPSLTPSPSTLEYTSSWSQPSGPIATGQEALRKSYSMTNWSPHNRVPLNPASGSSASYLASVASSPASMPTHGSGWVPMTPSSPTPETTPSFTSSLQSNIDSTAAPYGSSSIAPTTIDDDLVVSFSAPAPSPLGLAFTGDYLSSLGVMSNSAFATSVKKSYSMTDWEPGTRVNNAVTNPYLTNMNYAPRGSAVSPFSPSPSYSAQAAPAPVPVSYSSVEEPTNGASVSWAPSNGASVSWAPTNGASVSWMPTNGASVTINYATDSKSVSTANERERALA